MGNFLSHQNTENNPIQFPRRICFSCNGKGVYEILDPECYKCNGTGRDILVENGIDMFISCLYCGGSGKRFHNTFVRCPRCPRCHGKYLK